ncbi:unnamed protein product [Tetraodon nigroviridis]|uniref:(spotted green pufferfish) hypothetical protein n=1 Tax=Tetraodon nigroviridis TaxID=99883 RepID=Q4STA6_TETNG|nr:unnamed protein product [Tetraodon nigroviridis]
MLDLLRRRKPVRRGCPVLPRLHEELLLPSVSVESTKTLGCLAERLSTASRSSAAARTDASARETLLLRRLPGKKPAVHHLLLWQLLCATDLLGKTTLMVKELESRLSNCSHPLVPEHGGFRCDPSPCQGFPLKTTIRFFCESGYHISNKVEASKCRHGKWLPPVPACIPIKEGPNVNSRDGRLNDSVPSSMATTAVGMSIFLLTTTACLVIKSRLLPCQSHSRRSSDQLDFGGGRTSCLPAVLRGGGVQQLGGAPGHLLHSRAHPAPAGPGVPQQPPASAVRPEPRQPAAAVRGGAVATVQGQDG